MICPFSLSVDFILQPEAFVSTYSWGHMITFSAVQAQKWGSSDPHWNWDPHWSQWATGYVNFEIHLISACVFLKVVISVNQCFYFLSTLSTSWNCQILKFQLIWWYALMWNNCISLFQFQLFLNISEIKQRFVCVWNIRVSSHMNLTIKLFVSNCIVGVVVAVYSLSHVWLLDSVNCSMPGLPVLLYLPELAQTHVHCVSDAIQPSHPLSSPSPPAFNLAQHQGLFHWVGSSHQVAKVLELQFQQQSFQWMFRGDFLELTGLISLQSKGLLRVFSNTTIRKRKFSAQPSSWVQLSHLYMATGKIIALTL